MPLASAIVRIDRTVEEAARVAGATQLRVFLKVILPLSLPGLAVGASLVFSLSSAAYVTPQVSAAISRRGLHADRTTDPDAQRLAVRGGYIDAADCHGAGRQSRLPQIRQPALRPLDGGHTMTETVSPLLKIIVGITATTRCRPPDRAAADVDFRHRLYRLPRRRDLPSNGMRRC